MIRIKIIAMAHLKEKYFRDAAAEYEKRLSRYCRLETVELEPARLPERPSAAEISAALESEADMILKRIPDGAAVTALCVEGKRMSSEAFGSELARVADYGGGSMIYIIGSSYGLSERVKRRAGLCLSLSDMTFPHRLFRIMLLEQIYRAFKINEGSGYHK